MGVPRKRGEATGKTGGAEQEAQSTETGAMLMNAVKWGAPGMTVRTEQNSGN